MTDATKQKFLVLHLIPVSVMADWAKTDRTIRQPEEQKMKSLLAELCRQFRRLTPASARVGH